MDSRPERTGGQALRVLLVSPHEELHREVGEALSRWSGEQRLYWVAQPGMAVARAQELAPQAVLLDSDLDGADPLPLIRQLASRAPHAAVLALVEWDAMTRASQAVLAGARGFVIKPIQADELLSALRQVISSGVRGVAEAEQVEATGRVVAFCAPKGGTGRTTLAINTAVGLKMASKRPVVLVDADYAAPALDVALNLHTDHNITDLLPRVSRLDADLVASVLARHTSGLEVLLAPPPSGLEAPISLPQVQQIMAQLKRMFPWVVVDLGLPLDDTAFSFLDGADRIIMTVLPEMVGLRNTRLMFDQMAARGYSEDKVWLVVNRATMAGGVKVRDIESRLRVPVRYAIPDDQPLATHSINRGVPLVVSHGRSAVARAVLRFAQELLEEASADAEPAGARRWLPLLGQARQAAEEDGSASALRLRPAGRGAQGT